MMKNGGDGSNGGGDDSNCIPVGPGSIYVKAGGWIVFSTDVTRCVVQGGGERHEL